MSISISLQDAQARLPEIINNLAPNEEVIIVDNERPIARLVGQQHTGSQRPKPGLCQDMITIVVEDDEHLHDFAEYMRC